MRICYLVKRQIHPHARAHTEDKIIHTGFKLLILNFKYESYLGIPVI
jgi:hypothetical protein